MKKGLVLLLTLTVLLGFSGAANAYFGTIGTASYLGNSYNLIYEGQLGGQGLVWLDYTNVIKYQPNHWQVQVNWASSLGNSLTVTLNPGYSTSIDWSTGWRLPSTDASKVNQRMLGGWQGPDAAGFYNYGTGFNMINSELGHLYYVSLGDKGYYAKDGTHPQDWGLLNTGDFENLLSGSYWSGTQNSPYAAWSLSFYNGLQSSSVKGASNFDGYGYFGLALHPGDVSFVSVVDVDLTRLTRVATPVPGSVLLLGPGLAGLALIKRRFKK